MEFIYEIDLNKVAMALEKFLCSEIGIGITWFMLSFVFDCFFFFIILFVLIKIAMPITNLFLETMKNKNKK